MTEILEFLKGRIEQVSWLGLLCMAVAAVLVYGASPIADRVIRQEEKRKSAMLVFKLIGLGLAILAMLLLTKII